MNPHHFPGWLTGACRKKIDPAILAFDSNAPLPERHVHKGTAKAVPNSNTIHILHIFDYL